MGNSAALALLAIFVIIFSIIKLTLSDPVGISGFIMGLIALLIVVFVDVWPVVKR